MVLYQILGMILGIIVFIFLLFLSIAVSDPLNIRMFFSWLFFCIFVGWWIPTYSHLKKSKLIFRDIDTCRKATPEFVVEQIEDGKNINAQDKVGRNALMLACVYNKDPDVIVTLIINGADVNGQSEDGKTPLMYACAFSKSADVVQALLDNGADVNIKNDNKTAWKYMKRNIFLNKTEIYYKLAKLTNTEN